MSNARALITNGSGTVVFDSPVGSLEDIDAIDSGNAGRFNEGEESGRLWTYTTPSDAFLDVKTLFINVDTNQFWTQNANNNARQFTGKVFIEFGEDGIDTVMAEIWTSSYMMDRGNLQVGPDSGGPGRRGFINFGPGIFLEEAQSLAFFYSPDTSATDGVQPVILKITVVAVNGDGDLVTIETAFKPRGQGALQEAGRITADAGGINIKTVQVHTSLYYPIAVREMELRINGVIRAQLGDWCLNTLNANRCNLTVPLVTRFPPKTQIELWGRVYGGLSHQLSATLIANRVPIGFPRSRSVNNSR